MKQVLRIYRGESAEAVRAKLPSKPRRNEARILEQPKPPSLNRLSEEAKGYVAYQVFKACRTLHVAKSSKDIGFIARAYFATCQTIGESEFLSAVESSREAGGGAGFLRAILRRMFSDRGQHFESIVGKVRVPSFLESAVLAHCRPRRRRKSESIAKTVAGIVATLKLA